MFMHLQTPATCASIRHLGISPALLYSSSKPASGVVVHAQQQSASEPSSWAAHPSESPQSPTPSLPVKKAAERPTRTDQPRGRFEYTTVRRCGASEQEYQQQQQPRKPPRRHPASQQQLRGTNTPKGDSSRTPYLLRDGTNLSAVHLRSRFATWQQLQAWAQQPEVWRQLQPWHVAQLLVATAQLLAAATGTDAQDQPETAAADSSSLSAECRASPAQPPQPHHNQQQQQQSVQQRHCRQPQTQQQAATQGEAMSAAPGNWRLRWLCPDQHLYELSRFSFLKCLPAVAASRSLHHSAQQPRQQQQQQQYQERGGPRPPPQQQQPQQSSRSQEDKQQHTELQLLASWCLQLLERAASARCHDSAAHATASSTLLYWMFQLSFRRKEAAQYLEPELAYRLTTAMRSVLVAGFDAAAATMGPAADRSGRRQWRAGPAAASPAAAAAGREVVSAAVVMNLLYFGVSLRVLLPAQAGSRVKVLLHQLVAAAMCSTAARLQARQQQQQQQQHQQQVEGQRLGKQAQHLVVEQPQQQQQQGRAEQQGGGSGWALVSLLLWVVEFSASTKTLTRMTPQDSQHLYPDVAAACWQLLQVSGPVARLQCALVLIKRLIYLLPPGETQPVTPSGAAAPMLPASIAVVLGMTPAQLDVLFTEAAGTGSSIAGAAAAVAGKHSEPRGVTAAAGAAPMAAAAAITTAAAAADGIGWTPAEGGAAALSAAATVQLPKQLMQQLVADQDTASNLLQWVTPASCQLPAPLLTALFEAVAPGMSRCTAEQLRSYLRAGAALWRRGVAPPDSFVQGCIAAALALPVDEAGAVADVVWTLSHWGVNLWWAGPVTTGTTAEPDNATHTPQPTAAAAAQPGTLPGATPAPAAMVAASEAGQVASAASEAAGAAAGPAPQVHPLARKLIWQIKKCDRLSEHDIDKVLQQVPAAMSLVPGPVPPALLDGLGRLGMMAVQRGTLTPSTAARWLPPLTAAGWGPGLAAQQQQQLVHGLMDLMVGAARSDAHHSRSSRRSSSRGSFAEGASHSDKQSLGWGSPVVLTPLLTALAAGRFVSRIDKEWWLLTQQLLSQQWHRYVPGQAVALLQALGVARVGLSRNMARMVLERIQQGIPTAQQPTSAAAEAAATELQLDGSPGEQQTITTSSSSSSNNRDRQLLTGQLAAVLPSLAQLQLQPQQLPRNFWACYQAATAAAAPGMTPRQLVHLLNASCQLQWPLVNASGTWLTSLLTALTVKQVAALTPDLCMLLCNALTQLADCLDWSTTTSSSSSSAGMPPGSGGMADSVHAVPQAAAAGPDLAANQQPPSSAAQLTSPESGDWPVPSAAAVRQLLPVRLHCQQLMVTLVPRLYLLLQQGHQVDPMLLGLVALRLGRVLQSTKPSSMLGGTASSTLAAAASSTAETAASSTLAAAASSTAETAASSTLAAAASSTAETAASSTLDAAASSTAETAASSNPPSTAAQLVPGHTAAGTTAAAPLDAAASQQQQQQQQEQVCQLVLAGVAPVLRKYSMPGLLALLQGLHLLGLQQLPADIAERVQRRTAMLLLEGRISGRQVLQLMQALLKLQVLPEPSLLNVEGYVGDEVLEAIQELKDTLDELLVTMGPAPAPGDPQGRALADLPAAVDEGWGGSGEPANAAELDGDSFDWDGWIDAARADLELVTREGPGPKMDAGDLFLEPSDWRH